MPNRPTRRAEYVCSDCGSCWIVVEELVDERADLWEPGRSEDTWCGQCGGPLDPVESPG